MVSFILHLLTVAYNFCKQFVYKTVLPDIDPVSMIMVVFLKELFLKLYFFKKSAELSKQIEMLPRMQRVSLCL